MGAWPFYLLVVISLACLLCCSAANEEKKLPYASVMVVGTVVCNTCFQHQPKSSHFISGASVTIECGVDAMAKPNFKTKVKTNRHGVFRVPLPPQLSRHIKTIKSCSVTLIKSNHPFCAIASSTTSPNKIHLRSRRNHIHIFSAGLFTFKPLKQPDLCYQKPKALGEIKPAFFPPIPFLPPPTIGGVPIPPNPFQPPSILPPNPLLPPPSLLPPLPLQPSPPSLFPPLPFQPSPPSLFPPLPFQPSPPSLFPPLPFQPSPPPFFNLPSVPFLTPPPPPPAFQFPPFPFLPNPFFPGVPPASHLERTTSP